MKLSEAFEIKNKDIISLVGGGGKTTLMFALARELAGSGSHVITTTTTRIAEPSASDTEYLMLSPDTGNILEKARECVLRYRNFTVAKEKLAPEKLKGIPAEAVHLLASIENVDNVIVEADGSAQHSLKAHREHEPVIPAETALVIAVAGIDALGERLDRAAFQPELTAALLKVPMDTRVTPDLIARLVANKSGLVKGSPGAARIVAFINKVDVPGGLENGRLVAKAILEQSGGRIERVVLGKARESDPVVEVVLKT